MTAFEEYSATNEALHQARETKESQAGQGRVPNYRGLGRTGIIGRFPSGAPITENYLLFEQAEEDQES